MSSDTPDSDHTLEQIRRWRGASAGQRLQWLEQAKAFAALARAAAERRRAERSAAPGSEG